MAGRHSNSSVTLITSRTPFEWILIINNKLVLTTYPGDLGQGHKPVVIDINCLPHPPPLPLGLRGSRPGQPLVDLLPVDDGDICTGHGMTCDTGGREAVTGDMARGTGGYIDN